MVDLIFWTLKVSWSFKPSSRFWFRPKPRLLPKQRFQHRQNFVQWRVRLSEFDGMAVDKTMLVKFIKGFAPNIHLAFEQKTFNPPSNYQIDGLFGMLPRSSRDVRIRNLFLDAIAHLYIMRASGCHLTCNRKIFNKEPQIIQFGSSKQVLLS